MTAAASALHELADARLWSRPMYQALGKALTGWRAGWAANRVKLRLNGHTATTPGRRLTGEELEAAKRRLLEQYRGNQQPPDTVASGD